MLRTRHKSWFGVATADMFITSEHQPLGFGGCSQWAWIDCRNRRCRSGRHEEYQAFEADVVADYDARTAMERELVPCFASLLWRIRRATAIETDLLQIQAEILEDRRYTLKTANEAEHSHSVVYRVLRTTTRRDAYNVTGSRGDRQRKQVDDQSDSIEASSDNPVSHSRDLTCCFLRLANLDSGVFERLGRYETALWRQIVQTLLALRTIRYR